jgi:hypothetical protein
MAFHFTHTCTTKSRLGRSLIGIVAAYTFFIQTLLVGLIGAQFEAKAAAQFGLVHFELCLSDQDVDQSGSGLPAGHAGSAGHCVLCVAGADQVAAPPAVVTIEVLAVAAGVMLPHVDWRNRPLPYYSAARPRGPPRVV